MLQLVHDRKSIRKTIYRCKPGDWDEKAGRVRGKVKNAAYINHLIAEKFMEAERQLFKIKIGTEKPENIFVVKGDGITLEHAIVQDLARLKADMKAGSYNKLRGFQKELSEFCNISSLTLQEMDLKWFSMFASHLQRKGNIGSTAQKKMKTIRAIVARYSDVPIKEDLKNFSIKSAKSVKQKLTPEELASLENIELAEGDILEAVRDLFLLQVYLRGIRIGDLLQARYADFDKGVFSYVDDKTGQSFNIKLIDKAQSIVDKYAGKHERLFPFMRCEPNNKLSAFENKRNRMKEKQTATSVVNKYLKILGRMVAIEKPLSSHIARHTFARMALDKINNPMVTMELLGHSSLAIHQTYLNDLRKDHQLDQAAADIFK
jgi:integrase